MFYMVLSDMTLDQEILKKCIEDVNQLIKFHNASKSIQIIKQFIHGVPVPRNPPNTNEYKQEMRTLLLELTATSEFEISKKSKLLAVVVFNHHLMHTWHFEKQDIQNNDITANDLKEWLMTLGINLKSVHLDVEMPDIPLQPAKVKELWNNLTNDTKSKFKDLLEPVHKAGWNIEGMVGHLKEIQANVTSDIELNFIQELINHKEHVSKNIEIIVSAQV